MQDQIQKTFVRSFVDFLKKQIDSHTLTADAQESVEVAVQCLEAAFDIEDVGDEQQNSAPTASGSSVAEKVDAKEIDLFEMFQSLYIERKPESLQMAESIKNEGNRLMKDGKYNEALLQYNRAITFDPKNAIFYCNRAAAYIRLGDNERAVTDCKSALVYNPNYSKAYGRLGIAYSNLAKYDEAQQAYAKAIELEPDNQDYRNNLEVARNARAQIPQNAVPQLTQGLNAMFSNPAIRNLFNSADVDLEYIQSLSQNPMIMNAIVQMFSVLNGAGAGAGANAGTGGTAGANTGSGAGTGGPGVNADPGAPGAIPGLPNDMWQMYQFITNQWGSMPNQNADNDGSGNNQSNPQPPPPSP